MRPPILLLLYLIAIFSLLSCTQNITNVSEQPPEVKEPIPAKIAISPILLTYNFKIELPGTVNINIPEKIASKLTTDISEALTTQKLFSDVLLIPEYHLPPVNNPASLSQAAHSLGYDLVLTGRILDFKGTLEYGFRSSIAVDLEVELVLLDTALANRVWYKRQRVSIPEDINVVQLSAEDVQEEYFRVASEKAIPKMLSMVVPAMHRDLTTFGYRPQETEMIADGDTEFRSDVDRVPTVYSVKRDNAYALVIGIEKYRDLPAAEFADRDAKLVKEYLINVMGFPEENIVSLINARATKNDIEGYSYAWLSNNIERDSILFLYYAGHGAPNPVTGEAFIIPYDGNPAFPDTTGIPLKKFYATLSGHGAEETLVVLDACFSGYGGRSVIQKGSRPIAISVENPIMATNKLIVMAASRGTEISSSYNEQKHGLFTYFFLKGLQGDADFNADSKITIRELYQFISPQVTKVARRNNVEQTPLILPSIDQLDIRADFAIAGSGK